jgi:SAM-dependent methyltransferase
MSLVSVLTDVVPELGRKTVYELSSSGPLFNFLNKKAGTLVSSEFYDDVAPGEYKDGVQCQDVQTLTFPDESFDVCTSTEVFEHVPDDMKGFLEVHRVLRSEGIFIFTVPIQSEMTTIERAKIVDGKIMHMMEPEYHDDRIRGIQRVLAFRHYGKDILDRLRSQGFSRPQLVVPEPAWFGYRRSVVVGWK